MPGLAGYGARAGQVGEEPQASESRDGSEPRDGGRAAQREVELQRRHGPDQPRGRLPRRDRGRDAAPEAEREPARGRVARRSGRRGRDDGGRWRRDERLPNGRQVLGPRRGHDGDRLRVGGAVGRPRPRALAQRRAIAVGEPDLERRVSGRHRQRRRRRRLGAEQPVQARAHVGGRRARDVALDLQAPERDVACDDRDQREHGSHDARARPRFGLRSPRARSAR